jgi:hypothetical protein
VDKTPNKVATPAPLPPVDTDPRRVHERLTEISRQAIETHNFDLFRPCFHLPHKLSTFDGSFILETDDDLREIFDEVVASLRANGATRYERISTSAKRVSPTRIAATHESYVYRGQTLLGEPAVALSTIDWIDGKWAVSAGQYAVSTDHALARITMEKTK